MTQIFTDECKRLPVTVIYTGGCVASLLRTEKMDGYSAVQLGVGEVKEKGLLKAYIGQFKKAGVGPVKWLREFRVNDAEKLKALEPHVGKAISPDIFSPGDYVDVSGRSKGKGFAGVMKRHNFSGLPASHGASDKERSPGSSGGGSGQPQRVLKGTRGPGRMGSDWVTTQKLEVVKVVKEDNLILIKGAVPGTVQGFVVVKETGRARKHKAVIAPKATKKSAGAVKKAAPKPAAKGK